MKNCESMKGLLVGFLDNELTPEERQEVNEHLTRCALCREEYERLRQTSDNVRTISFAEPDDATLAKVWKSPHSRLAHNASILMIIGGYALIAAYALFELLTNSSEGLPVRIGMAAIVLGLLILLFQLIRERVRTYKSDPYKEIER